MNSFHHKLRINKIGNLLILANHMNELGTVCVRKSALFDTVIILMACIGLTITEKAGERDRVRERGGSGNTCNCDIANPID